MNSGKVYSKESWLLVAAGLVLNLSFGMTTSFGLFFYTIIREYGWPMSVTAAVYSVYTVISGLSNVVSGRLSDRYSVNRLIAGGAAITALGFVLSGGASEVWHLYVTFGVMVGFGLGTFWVPSTSVISKSFDTSPRLKAAIAVATTGTGFGTILLPLISAMIIETFGRSTAFLLQGVFVVCIASPAIIIMKPKTHDAEYETKLAQSVREAPLGWQASAIFRSTTYWFVFVGYVLASLGHTALMVHLASFAVEKGMSLASASVAIGLTGVGTVFGRLVSGGPLGRLGEQKMLSCVLLLQSILMGLLFWIHLPLPLYAFSLAWGLLWGARVYLTPLLVRGYFGLLAFGVAYGVLNAGFGIGGLSGPTVVGYLHDVYGSYLSGFLFTSCMLLAGGVLMLLAGHTEAEPKNARVGTGERRFEHLVSRSARLGTGAVQFLRLLNAIRALGKNENDAILTHD